MLLRKFIENLGDLKGVIYTFEYAGDILEKHVHTEENNHITIVTAGKVKIYSHDWEVIAGPGRVLDFRVDEPHEFVALEDATQIMNIVKKYRGEVNDSQTVEQL
jgi:quercetin dioxygenase-like cupin family protein